MFRWLAGLVLVGLVVAGGAYWIAGRGAPPAIKIERPERAVGQAGTLDVLIEAPRGRLTALTIALEQNGRATPLFSLGAQQSATLTQVDNDHVRVSRPVGKQSVPELQQGPADFRDARVAHWFGKPAGMRYAELFGELAGVPGSLWMRQMVLGASPEFVLFAARDVALGVPATRVDVDCIWPAG